MMHPVIDTIIKRRSVRRFQDTPVDDERIQSIVECGRWAPTGGNCQTIHFTVIQNPTILKTLRDTVRRVFAQMPMSEDLYISLQHSIKAAQTDAYIYDYGAPCLVVVSNVKGYPNAMADSACALQNMMLAATELGVGSCWINQLHWLEDSADVREILASCGISDSETICGALALGLAASEPVSLPRKGMRVDFVR